jgi:hypothetical protein
MEEFAMGAWVWMLIGFTAGLVVAALFSLIFGKDPTAELEQAADEQGAQLSKAEMKAAVLQDKLLGAETALEEQNAKSEAECQKKLDAAEADYREKLAVLEKQFADLDAAFAARLAAEEEGEESSAEVDSSKGFADGVEAAVAEHDEDDGPGIAAKAAIAAGGVAAAAAILGDDEEGEEETAVVEAEPEELEPEEPAWPEDRSTWQGEYFNNTKLEGDPVLKREDAEIDFDWGLGSPAPEVNVDGFSARWKRTVNLPPGLYRFTVTSDDGARLWVNGRMVISAWYDHTAMTFRREMELPGGPVDLRLEYYENAMNALICVSWEQIG